MTKVRKKAVVVDAVRVPTESLDTAGWDIVIRFLKDHCEWEGGNRSMSIKIKTLEGTMEASPGDWIIRGVKGEFYPCKPGIFAATYEEV